MASLYFYSTSKRDLHSGINYSSAFFDRDGKLLRLELTHDEKYRLWTPLKAMSPHLVEATLVLEDRWFYYHPGVNPVATLRATWQTLVMHSATVGASTITMQLARLRYGLKTRSLLGKLRQMWLALALEWLYSKDEILEAYLNLAPYGSNIEGAGAASEIYFAKPVRELTVGEALLLSVLPQSPRVRAPSHAQGNFETVGMQTARDLLMRRWLARHPEKRPELSAILWQRNVRKPAQLPFRAPHFVDSLLPTAAPGAVHTTLDLGMQDLLERKLHGYIEDRKNIGVHNGAAMLLDYRSMEVLALVGSAAFRDRSIQGQVNGTRAKRSPGSTLKPFIYALAMDQGLIHPRTLLKDAATSFGEWRPENFDQDFAGPISAHDALIRSRNVPAIQVAAQLKSPTLYEFLQTAGITKLREERHYGLALVLGGAETTMEELVRLYAMLGNQGELLPVKYLRQVRRSDREQALPPGPRLISPEAAQLTLDILRDNPRPGRAYTREWVANDTPVAWKTGTSYSFRDAWAVGVVGPYVLAVWIGNFNGESNPAFVGTDMAGPLFFTIIDALKAQGLPPVPLRAVPRTTEVEVCAVSGKIPGPYCRNHRLSPFIPGKSPIAVCDIHRSIAVNLRSGLRACPLFGGGAATREEIFEFWDSDFLRLFRLAGVPRSTPPAWDPSCTPNFKARLGHPPRITSPRPGVVYNVRLGAPAGADLPLQAVTDADASKVFWFADHTFLGAAAAGKSFFWTPRPGSYMVQAVDNQGRSASAPMRVVAVE